MILPGDCFSGRQAREGKEWYNKIMATNYNARWIGLKELRLAIKRNPAKVAQEAKAYLVRGIAVYNRGIIRAPWRIGGSGGGSPVSNDPRYKRRNQRLRSGNLRDTHIKHIGNLMARIGPNLSAAPYARYVHDGTPGGQMEPRPWLDYVKKDKQGEIDRLYRDMLKNITRDLAR